MNGYSVFVQSKALNSAKVPPHCVSNVECGNDEKGGSLHACACKGKSYVLVDSREHCECDQQPKEHMK